MFRLFFIFTLFIFGSSAPYGGLNMLNIFAAQQGNPNEKKFQQNDNSEIVDNKGSGYSFFKSQQIETRPIASSPIIIPQEDLLGYMQSSALSARPVKQTNDQSIKNSLQQKQPIISSMNDQRQFNPSIYSLNQIAQPWSSTQQQQQQRQQFVPSTYSLDRIAQPWSQQKSNSLTTTFDSNQQKPQTSSFFLQTTQQNNQQPIVFSQMTSSSNVQPQFSFRSTKY